MVSAARSMPSSIVLDGTADEERGRGVEEHDVATRARFAAEDGLDHPGVLGRIAARSLAVARALEPERGRVDDVPLDAVAGDDVGHAAAVERQLVDAGAVDDERPLRAEPTGRPRPCAARPRRVADARANWRVVAGRVGQRPERG